MRQSHFIKLNHNAETPSQFIYFDTETKSLPVSFDNDGKVLSVKAKLILGWAVYERFNKENGNYTHEREKKFYTSKQFWEWVFGLEVREKSKVYIFAHNMGGFDLMVVEFAKYLTEAGYECKRAVLNCPPTILQYYNADTKRTLVFLDSLNFYRESLKDLGKAVGIEKLDMPKGKNVDMEKMSVYCRNDVEILRQAMHKFFEFRVVHDLGSFRTTTPSQALTCFRHRFMKEDSLFCDNNKDSLELARKSYHGGRTEAFYLGKETGEFYILDINSMYPFVMSDKLFPTKLYTVVKHDISINDLEGWLKEFFVIADIDVLAKENKYPAIDENKRLIFPIGRIKNAVLCSPEIVIEDVIRVNKVALYERELIFEDYVKYWYALKNQYKIEGNTSFYHLTKLFLNSLYGKFGQSGYVFETVEKDCPIEEYSIEKVFDVVTGKSFTQRVFGGIKQIEKREAESSDSIPSIASAVTSYARKYLDVLIRKANGSNVQYNTYYVDTDSLLVNPQGYKNLKEHIGEELGQLKVEKRIDYINIRGLKDYELDKIEKIKGIRLSSDTTEKIGDNKYIQDRFRSLKGALREGNVNEMIITRTPKELKRKYTKAVGDKGWLRPITFS